MARKIKVYGQARNRTALGIVNAYLRLNPDATIDMLREAFPDTIAPDKGVSEIFIDTDFDSKGEHYFTEADELVDISGGKIAVVRQWSQPSFDNLARRARDFGIIVAETGHQPKVGHKGSFYLEDMPDDATETVEEYQESRLKRGSAGWLWVLASILAIFILSIFVGRCAGPKHPVGSSDDTNDTIIVTNTVTAETGAAHASPE